eukprot:Nitzschia sp. Nitz4//scaffold76_size158648//53073//54689//NITZ4_002540-RA/size158648-processed-gene-0.171-mRNA-1//1//CDS//3329557827//823//frame0
MTRPGFMLLVLSLFGSLLASVKALKHSFYASDDHRPLGFPFGFTESGRFNLTVYDFEVTAKEGETYIDEPSEVVKDIWGMGFLLVRFQNEGKFNHYLNMLQANASLCAFGDFLEQEDSLDTALGFDDDQRREYGGDANILNGIAEEGLFLDMNNLHFWGTNQTARSHWEFYEGEQGLYFLLFQICGAPEDAHFHTSFELDIHHTNLDVFHQETYLSVGERSLPHVFFYYSVLYATLFILWVSNIRLIQGGEAGHFQREDSGQAVVYPIHHLMSILLLLKFCTIFFESVRYHFLRVTGHAEFWSSIYYIFLFLKGSLFFTVVLLLGSGWSFVKPFLSDKERNIICVILVLQVINNIALIVLTQETEGETAYDRWTVILHIVDIVCCCAILIPIVWQVNTLEKNLQQSGNHHNDDIVDLQEDLALPEDEFEEEVPRYGDVRLTSKLRLFRNFYLMVVGYIYLTRIVVYLFATVLDYRHTWLRHFIVELVTLAFYVTVGYQFRPMSENPYLAVDTKTGGKPKDTEIEMQVKTSKLQD